MLSRTLRAVLTTAIAGLTIAAAAVAQAAPEFVFKLHHLLGAKAPAQTKMLEPWAAQVEKNSGGRVKIDIYPAMSLGGQPPQLIR